MFSVHLEENFEKVRFNLEVKINDTYNTVKLKPKPVRKRENIFSIVFLSRCLRRLAIQTGGMDFERCGCLPFECLGLMKEAIELYDDNFKLLFRVFGSQAIKGG